MPKSGEPGGGGAGSEHVTGHPMSGREYYK